MLNSRRNQTNRNRSKSYTLVRENIETASQGCWECGSLCKHSTSRKKFLHNNKNIHNNHSILHSSNNSTLHNSKADFFHTLHNSK